MNTVDVQITGSGADSMIEAYNSKLAKNPGDCGIDLYPVVSQINNIQVSSLGFYDVLSIPTEVRMSIPEGHFAWITGRSSSPNKLMGCQVLPGVIDHGYTGEYLIRIQIPFNGESKNNWLQLAKLIIDYSTSRVAIAQAIILPFAQALLIQVPKLEATGRGSKGFGSTDGDTIRLGASQFKCRGCGTKVMLHEYYCGPCNRKFSTETVS